MWFVDVIFKSSHEILAFSFIFFLVSMKLRSIITASHNCYGKYSRKWLFKDASKRVQENLLKTAFVYARTQNDSVIEGTFFIFFISPHASPTFSYMGKHCVFFNAHDLDWLIFPIINYISEECETVSFGPSLLHLRSQGVEQQGIIG